MERLRAVGVNVEASGPSPYENDAGAWLVQVDLNRSLTQDERKVFQRAWQSYRAGDTPPVLNFPHLKEAGADLRVADPEALAQVVPKFQAMLDLVMKDAAELAAQREAERQRVRDAIAGIDWSV